MRKPSVSEKILGLCDLFTQRIEANLKEEFPESAIYWESMVHSQFILARAMLDDKQMTSEVFSEINHYDTRALKLLSKAGPAGGPRLEGSRLSDNSRFVDALRAYDRLRQESQMMGLF